MLDSLITSKTRIRLLVKFFLNPAMKAYLRGLSDEFGESTNAIRLELNRMEEAGLLCSEEEGKKKVYHANPSHPLFNDIHSLVLKHSGITQLIEEVIVRMGDIHEVWVVGDFAEGKDVNCIDIVILGTCIDNGYFLSLIEKTEKTINRTIHYVIVPSQNETSYLKHISKKLLVWKK